MSEEETRRMAQLEWFKNSLEHHENLSAAVVSFGQSLLRGSLTLNGGAIIALLSIYGILNNKSGVLAPILIWALGLGFCAVAAICAARSQREFQASAGENYRELAKHFFGLETPHKPGRPHDVNWGYQLRDWFWGLCLGSIAAFIIGAVVALWELG